MSEQNVAIVRHVYDAIVRGDTDSVLASYDPDVEWEFSRSPFRGLVKHSLYRGHDCGRADALRRLDDARREDHSR